MMLDADREKDIALGTRYPFDALGEGEVILHDTWRTKSGYKIGD